MLICEDIDKYRERTLTRDLIMGLTLAVFGLLSALGTIYYIHETGNAIRKLEERADDMAEKFSTIIAHPLWNVEYDLIRRISEAYLNADEYLIRIQIKNEKNDIIFDNNFQVEDNIVVREEKILNNRIKLGTVKFFFSIKRVNETRNTIIITMIITLFSVIIIIVFVTHVIMVSLLNRPLKRLIRRIQTIASGDYQSFLEEAPQKDINKIINEINIMARCISERTEQLKQSEKKYRSMLNDLTDAVNREDYSLRIADSTDNDLVASLNKILISLEMSAIESKNRHWIKTGQTELNDYISGEKSIDDLCRIVITFICRYIDIQVGVIYIQDEETVEVLKMMGGFAVGEEENIESFRYGEGLVGEVALKKERIIIKNIPDGYLNIRSSIGNALPKDILIFPLIYDGHLKGVIELGSAKSFTLLQIEFTDIIAPAIAAAINSVLANQKLKNLLSKTQKQAQELHFLSQTVNFVYDSE